MIIGALILIITFIIVGACISSDDESPKQETKTIPYSVYIENYNKNNQGTKEKFSYSLSMKEEFNKINNNMEEMKKELVKEMVQEFRINRQLNNK